MWLWIFLILLLAFLAYESIILDKIEKKMKYLLTKAHNYDLTPRELDLALEEIRELEKLSIIDMFTRQKERIFHGSKR